MIVKNEREYDISEEKQFLDDVAGNVIEWQVEVAKDVVDNIGFLFMLGPGHGMDKDEFIRSVKEGDFDEHLLDRFVYEEWPYILALAKDSLNRIDMEE